MATSTEFDTLDTTKVKIINNVRSLASTLQVASDDLRNKGYDVPAGNLYQVGITMTIPSINPETMVIELLKRSKHHWDDIFNMDTATITPLQIEEIKEGLPERLASLISPLLACYDKDGAMAIDPKILDLLIKYVRSFIKLGLKVVYFKRDEYEADLQINLHDELKLRSVTGLPGVMVN